jgi:PAS domain S-box-containing protein
VFAVNTRCGREDVYWEQGPVLSNSKTFAFRATVAVAFGLIGFAVNFLDIQLIEGATFKISILAGLFFPLLVALAWGWRYGLLSALAGGCQTMWWLWQSDGWGILYSVPVFTLWIVWHGWWAGRRHEGHPWYLSQFAVEIPFRIVIELGFMVIFRWLVSLNPPPWDPSITWDQVGSAWLQTVALKHTITAYVLLMTAHVVLSLGPVRRFFGLPPRSAQRDTSVIYAGAVLFGLLLWVLDALASFFVFPREGQNFWSLAVHGAGTHEVFMRSIYVVAAVFAGVVLSIVNRRRVALQELLDHRNRILSAIRNVNQLIVREKDPNSLLDEACRLLVETHGYDNVWIALTDDGRLRKPFYHAGFDGGFSPMTELLSAGDIPVCARTALSADGVQVVIDPAVQCTGCPLAPTYDDRAGLCLRLEHAGRVFGWMSLSCPVEYACSSDEHDLITEVAGDIAFALWAIEKEKQRETIAGKYADILASTRDTVIASDMEGLITVFNPGAERLFGCSADEVLGTPITRFCPEDLLEEQAEVMRRLSERGSVSGYESERLTADGRRIPVEVTLSLNTDDLGRPLGFNAIYRDITERKQAEASLRQNHAMLSRTERIANVGSWEWDIEADHVRWSEELFRILQRDPSLGAPSFSEHKDIYLAEDMDLLKAAVEACVSKGTPYELELRAIRTDGTIRNCVARGQAEYDDTGRINLLVGSLQDITERKRAEEERESLVARLREADSRVRAKLNALLAPEGDIGELSLADVLDVTAIQAMMDNFLSLTGIGVAILDAQGRVLVATGWQDICTKFHRIHPETSRHCSQSDIELSSGIEPGEVRFYQCRNHLWDVATPIMLGDQRAGNVFFGQFFFEDETPDREVFRALARQYGFDEEAYLAAVDRVPRWSRERVDQIMSFYADLARQLSELSYGNIRLARTLAQRDTLLERLASNEERLRLALKATNDVVWDWDIVCDALRWNEAGITVFGWTDIVEAPQTSAWWLDRIHPDDRMRVNQSFLAAIGDQATDRWRDEYRFRKADGTDAHVADRGHILRDSDGNATRVIGAMLDISELKRVEEALRESETRFRFLVDYTYDLIWTLTSDGVLAYVSPSWKTRLGYEQSYVEGRAFQQLMHPDDVPDCEAYLSKVLEEKKPLPSPQYRVKHADGSWRWHEAAMTPVYDEKGSFMYLVGVSRDITERRRAEQEREQLQAQLTQAQKMEAVGRLAGGVAHDFNNMLGIIIGHADLLLEQTDPDQPSHADLSEIREAGARSADLTRQLLAFARKQTVAPRVIDLNETVEGMLKMLHRLIGEDIEMTWIPCREMRPVKIDPGQVDQILANLCVNARDAIAGVGRMTIESGIAVFNEAYCRDHAGFLPGEYAVLAVSDNGCGMDSETISHLFEPFFTTKELGKGTGLGLATVYGVVKQNNGFINVCSEPGQGTTFRIYLPCHRVRTLPLPEKRPEASNGSGHEIVLLVEDEPAILKMTKRMLEREGYTVVTAGTPGEAIRLAHEHKGDIHLLITDVVMPEMNGRDLARNILPLYPGLKCLFMSGFTADVIAHHGVLDEGVNFIQKPFSMSELTAKLREVLDRDHVG